MYQVIPWIIFTSIFIVGNCKYIEGELNTSENWAFLGRFCFLSVEGLFEYRFEFDDDVGNVNLLLYYDTEDQWPAVYKTGKNCHEKESALRVENNQIINLTYRNSKLKVLSGCSITPNDATTVKPRYTISIPTVPPRKKVTKPETEFYSTTPMIELSSIDYNETELYDLNFESTNQTELENITEATHSVPIRKRAATTKPPLRRHEKVVTCQNARRFQSSRERWWFIAVSNCNGTKGLHLRYKMLMTNGPPGDYWHEHFSADEFYILPILMGFSIIYCFLILGIVMCSVELKSRQLLHSTYKLFVFSVVFQIIGIMLQSMAYLKYAVNGIGSPNAKMFGSMLMGCSEICFLLLLLLLAKGYTITRGRLSLQSGVKLTIFMCLYVVTYITLFIYQEKVFDPGLVLYLFESPAGFGLISLRIFAWFMFVYGTVITLKHYPEKNNFYYPFNICGTLWFIAGPAFIISANTYIDKWVRESVVCCVLLFIAFGGHLTFLLLTMPSVANKNFPYHVRTTQVGVMELGGGAGSSTIEHFSHHVYEPTEQTVIIPLTKRTEEIYSGIYTQRLYNHTPRTEEEFVVQNDVQMENVINWAQAKNVAAIELPQFERIIRRSMRSDISNDSGAQSVFGSHQTNRAGDDYEYVKEVPVELFTISKMVISTSSERRNVDQ